MKKNRNDKRTLTKVLISDFFILDLIVLLIIALSLLIKAKEKQSDKEMTLSALNATLENRDEQGWSRPSSYLLWDYSLDEYHRVLEYDEDPYSLIIDNTPYEGEDANSLVLEAYSTYGVYDSRSNIEGIISFLDKGTASFSQTSQDEGSFSINIALESEDSISSLFVSFESYMISRDSRVISGSTISNYWVLK